MADPHADVLRRALASDPDAQRELLRVILPVIRARTLIGLRRRATGTARGRDPNQESADLTQEVLVALLDDGCRVLRAWDPSRGLSLKNYVGLVAARQVASILRTGRRSPWSEDPTPESDLVGVAGLATTEAGFVARELFDRLLQRLYEEVSPRGMQLFRALFLEERPIGDVCRDFQMTEAAAYAWRSRLVRRAKELAIELQGPDSSRAQDEPIAVSRGGR
jgi:DNA-directed RNA polymerase specialized sigma24 family protein